MADALFPTNRDRAGLAPEHETWFNLGLATMFFLFAAGWSYAVYRSFATQQSTPQLTRSITTSPLSPEAPPEAAYLLNAALQTFATKEFRGASGALRVVVRKPDEPMPSGTVPSGVQVKYQQNVRGGLWNVLVAMGNAMRPVQNLTVVPLIPLSAKRGGKIGSYNIGSWPFERGGAPKPAYAPPAGLIEVTPENLNTPISAHFKLGDFLTKGQQNVWPKYVAMSPRLLDKLELIIKELQDTGTPVQHVGIISAFRTPSYNHSGGDPTGRAALSRHMYGDAMDIYIDNDHDGGMDDLNHDGRVDSGDGRVIVAAANSVERKFPELIGGVGLYAPTGAHRGFVHIDTRGFHARWGGAT